MICIDAEHYSGALWVEVSACLLEDTRWAPAGHVIFRYYDNYIDLFLECDSNDMILHIIYVYIYICMYICSQRVRVQETLVKMGLLEEADDTPVAKITHTTEGNDLIVIVDGKAKVTFNTSK